MGLRSCGMRCRRLVASRYAAINQHSSSFLHLGLSALLALTLTACGGGGGGTDTAAQDNTTTAQEAAAPESTSERSETAQATSTETWTLCAAEGQTCTVPATAMVRYGIEGKYLYKTVSGSIGCNNTQWTDPAVGIVKHCDYASATTTAAAGSWSQVAVENQSFSLASAQTVRYGTGTSWVERTVSGAGFCANWYFGADPAPGQVKRCETQGSGSGGTTTTASGWNHLANENQPISLASASLVRYGVGSLWVQRTVSGGGVCSNWFFGVDPAPNQVKHCEVIATSGTATPSPAPAPAPTAPAATLGSALLQWSATGGGNVAGYRVYWGTSPGNYQQAKGSGLGAGNATSYAVQNLPGGQTYYFAVTAYDSSGAESGYSTEASKTIQ